jgi:hypothetical protein
MQLSVKADITRALRKFDLTEQDAKRAIPRALNKTATTARANAAREIRSAGYNIKVSGIKRQLSIRRASADELVAIVRATGRPIPLINYGARQTKTGVSVKVLRGRTVIKGAFIATMPSGHRGVFVRVDSAAGRRARLKGFGKVKHGQARNGKHGLPIQQLFGPSVPSAFGSEVVQRATVEAIRDRFPKVLAQELHYVQLKNAGV